MPFCITTIQRHHAWHPMSIHFVAMHCLNTETISSVKMVNSLGFDMSSSSFNFHDCVPTTHSDTKWQSIHQIQKYIVTNKVLVKYGEAFTQLSNDSDIGNIT